MKSAAHYHVVECAPYQDQSHGVLNTANIAFVLWSTD